MTDNLPATATPQTCSGKPSGKLDRISELLRTLAPVRPIGMSDQMAHDWAAVILAEAAELNDWDFAKGCKNARHECTDHRQILKHIMKGDPEMTAWQAKLDTFGKSFSQHKTPALEGPAAKLITNAAKGCRA